MSDFQAIADRVEIEALRGEFTDAAMMRDRARLASLFTPDGALRMPNIPAELVGREDPRRGRAAAGPWDFFVQTTHPGTIQLDGDTATGRAYIQELARARDGRSGPELRHLPRPLPAHRRRLEVHRAGLRGQVPRHHSAGGLGARAAGRPPTRPNTLDEASG